MSHSPISLFQAIELADDSAVQQALQAGVNVNAKDSQGLTPLMRAAGLGNTTTTQLLLAQGADVTILDSVMGTSALHFAAQGGNVAVGQLILDYGGQILLNLQGPTHGLSPLHCAVWYRQPDFVQWLLAQPRINIHLKSHFGGATALDLVSPDQVRGTTSQPFAIADPRLQTQAATIRRYFEAYLQRRDQTDPQGQELFEVIVNRQALSPDQQLARVKALIAEGANVNYVAPVDSSGNDGHTPLLIAVRDGYADIVQILLENGADITLTEETMHANAAHKGGYYGQPVTLQVLTTAPAFSQIINAQGPSNGYTPLHDAVWHGHLETARVLVEAQADLTLKGYDGKTPIDLARDYQYDEIEVLLRQNQA